MSICEGFFDYESVGGVVVEGVAEGCGFGCALGCVIVACCLNIFTEFAVGNHEAWVGLLDVHGAKLDS